ncbi:MAG: ribosomal protein S18-alanine N-acetyltransferase [Clostridia bacterium]|nr:ribosomal protein S18-alanine N-acetyltransferase [Clostridia bacterium]
MKILPMEPQHVQSLAQLERACFAAPWSAEGLAEELDNPHAVFRVAEDDAGAVLGYVGMHHLVDEGFVTNVAVDPAARRQGVARGLLAALAAYGVEHGLYRITLEVRVSNTAAISLYESAGYRLDGVRPGFYRNPTEDAAIYSLYF